MAKQFNVVVLHGLQVGVQIIVAYSNPGDIKQAAINAAVKVHLEKYGASKLNSPIKAAPADGLPNMFAISNDGEFNCDAAVFNTYHAALAFAQQWYAGNMPAGI